MTLPKYYDENARARKARFAEYAKKVSAIARRCRVGDYLEIPPTIMQRRPRLSCLVCGNGIGRHECRNWKGQQP